MDISSGTGYPSGALSNFSPHPFVMTFSRHFNAERMSPSTLNLHDLSPEDYLTVSLVGIDIVKALLGVQPSCSSEGTLTPLVDI